LGLRKSDAMSSESTPNHTRARQARVVASVIVASLAAGLFAADLARRQQTEPDATEPILVVNPNDAPTEALLALPRLGPAMVERIIAERNRQPFRSLEDLDGRVNGIGPATISALAPHLRFDPAP
jgi:DNA uptake protein ComE-like DNA-binding protein